MKLQLNSNLIPIFRGTYENPYWEVVEINDDGDELNVEYDFDDYMKSIVEAYKDNEDDIKSELAQYAPFIKGLKINNTYFSPREYNFKTDEIDFEIDIEWQSLLETLESLANDKEFNQYLKDNFTSYDGFWSFTPNNYKDLVNSIKTKDSEFEQSIGALITYLAKNNIVQHGGVSIEEIVSEDWRGNGYKSLEYTIDDEDEEVK